MADPMTDTQSMTIEAAEAYRRGKAEGRCESAAAIRAAGPATLRILPAGHTGEVVLVDLAERYAALVEGLGG